MNSWKSIIIAQTMGLVGLSLLLLSAPVSRAAAPVAQTSRMLTVVETNGTKRLDSGVALYEFGQFKGYKEPKIEHVYELKNETKTAMTLDRLQPSCGCTSAVVVGGATTIEPGKSMLVQVDIATAMAFPGVEDKMVEVFIAGQPESAATLEIKGTILSGVSYSPETLDFGKVAPGGKAPKGFTATLQPELIVNGKAPHLMTTNETVIMTLKSSVTNPSGTITQIYDAEISSIARPGGIVGGLYWVDADNKSFDPLSRNGVSLVGVIVAPSATASAN